MQPFALRWLIPFTLIMLLLPACSDSADEDAATTVPTTTTAAPETTTPAVDVTAQADCVVDSDGTWSGPVLPESGEPGSAQRDFVITCTVTSSDPRVAGEWVTTADIDLTVNGEQFVADIRGTTTGTNDGGTWEATSVGTSTWSVTSPAHLHVIEQTATGSGDYEGLTYVTTIEGTDFPWTLAGRIEPTP